jgi:hypothetical protein
MPKKWGIPPNIQKRSSDSGFSLENRRQGVDRALKSVISKSFCKRLIFQGNKINLRASSARHGTLHEVFRGSR